MHRQVRIEPCGGATFAGVLRRGQRRVPLELRHPVRVRHLPQIHRLLGDEQGRDIERHPELRGRINPIEELLLGDEIGVAQCANLLSRHVPTLVFTTPHTHAVLYPDRIHRRGGHRRVDQ
ncbi:MAG: hypothetical protein ACK55I_17835 [bacterium]